MITGLRHGEQLQLTWNDVYEMEVEESRTISIELVKLPRALTSREMYLTSKCSAGSTAQPLCSG